MKKSLLFLALLFLNTTFTFASYSIDWMSTPDLLANTGTAIARDANDNVYSTTSTEGTILLEKSNYRRNSFAGSYFCRKETFAEEIARGGGV